jgi:hypothetical protein
MKKGEEGDLATSRFAEVLVVVAVEILAHPFPSLGLLCGGETERKGMVKRRK